MGDLEDFVKKTAKMYRDSEEEHFVRNNKGEFRKTANNS